MADKRRSATPASASPSPPQMQAGHSPTSMGQANNDPSSMRVEDIVRRDLDIRTRAVVDALYELASHAADGSEGSSQQMGESVYVQHVLSYAGIE